ncbi:3D domain protein [Thermincola potens JR]|uniref:3D domain protein n=1 Tax=Thermincola potens (strain JR) TaxID=635013 RepID=D5X8Z5_THEPJ|nr:3D domain protein [Thermincola potens JR]
MQAYTPPRETAGFFRSKLVIIGLGVVVLAGLILGVIAQQNKEIKIVDDRKSYEVTVFGGTVNDALAKAGIKLYDRDLVEPGLKTRLHEGMKITVTRAIDVNVIADGQTTKVRTPLRTVKEILRDAEIKISPLDKVEPQLDDELTNGDIIRITRVTEKTVFENRTIAFKTERQPDNRLYRGITHVVREGKNGVAQRTVKVTLEDGKEVKREVVGEKVVKEPVNKIVAFGTLREKTVSRGGSIRFSRVMVMNATGYTYTGHNTASGIPPRPGVAAVDPEVIPLGTKLYIEGYGYATALDVGSAIKGNKIDLFFATEAQADRWGRRKTKVYILE